MNEKKRAVVLLSGGLDSTTVLAIAVSEGYDIYGLTFRYGQRHAWELESAEKIAKSFKIKNHLLLDIDLAKIGGSALTDNIEVPKNENRLDEEQGIPITYVPARNTIFLSYALAWAEVLGASEIFIGVNAVDYSGYPDCRPEYVEAFENMANLATKAGIEGKMRVKIRTPLINMKKAEIIRQGIELGVDYAMTRSCYDPSDYGKPCGHCDSCLIRKRGFLEAGIADPAEYNE
jgi:7-cyano-7-deazaguanine synthase